MLRVMVSAESDTRSRKADFLELSAYFSGRQRSSIGDLLGAMDIAEDVAARDPLFDDETLEPLDQSILEETRQAISQEVFEELAYRESIVGSAYPFSVDYNAETITYRGDESLASPSRAVYIFCLLASAIRDEILEVSGEDRERLAGLKQSIGRLFQACSCLAAGAYLSGSVASFGFPRASGDGFLPALRAAYQRFGVGSVRRIDDEILEDLPHSVKDGGIDVIAWRELPDEMPAKLYMLGQCASGADWKDKSIIEYIEQLHGSWFTVRPATHTIPAMFIIFPFHHDLEQGKTSAFRATVKTRFWHEEKRFGIIFDRFRISHLVALYEHTTDAARAGIDGGAEIPRIRDWILRLTNLARIQAGVA
jgi:hypothetical protein